MMMDGGPWMNRPDLIGESGNLEMIRWMYNDPVEGLPIVDWPDSKRSKMSIVASSAAGMGHIPIIAWFKERGLIDQLVGTLM
jgi:hypothetical protein